MTAERDIPPDAPSLDISNVVAAFSEEQVERMIGLSKSRLRYWSRTGFFQPSFAEENQRLPFSRFYSFKDIVALRTLEMLRVQKGVALQHLRRVAETLSHLKDDLWIKTTLYVVDRKVIVVDPNTGHSQEVVSGQYLLGIPLATIVEQTRSDVIAFTRRPDDARGRVSRDRSVVRNAWVVAGTRVPVASITRLSEDGYGIDEIIAEYPDLSAEDIRAALKHGRSAAA